jgi:DUF1680 family protein
LIYATQPDANAVFIGFFIGSRAKMDVGGQRVQIAQETNYPWDGAVTIRVDPEKPVEFTLNVRIPGWARDIPVASDLYRFAMLERAPSPPTPSPKGEGTNPATAEAMPTLLVNGKAVSTPLTLDGIARDKGFARLRRTWKKGDVVQLTLPMPARRVLAHDELSEDRSKAAIQRGPLVYCVEAVDHQFGARPARTDLRGEPAAAAGGEANGGKTKNLRLPLDARLTATFKADLLGGVTVITGQAEAVADDGQRTARTLTAIPYYAWSNRGKGEMTVWIPHSPAPQ